MTRIYIDFRDGAYTWRPAENRTHGTIVEVPLWRVAWMRLIDRLSTGVSRYLAGLDNDWHDAQERKTKEARSP